MKLSEILLFITLLFTGWFGLEKQKQCDKKDELIIKQNARIELLDIMLKGHSSHLEYQYNLITNKCKPKKAK